MAIDSDEWQKLLDRFASKDDLDQFRTNVERILAVINAKLDQFVVKEMQALVLKQEETWKKDTLARMDSMQADLDAIKGNRLPTWVPNAITIIISILMLAIAYFHPTSSRGDLGL